MNRNFRQAAAAGILGIVLPTLAHGAVITGTQSQQGNNLFVNSLIAETQHTAWVSDPTAPAFDLQFSALGDETVRIDFNAPAGKAFFVDTPSGGWSSYAFSASYAGGASGYVAGAFLDNSPKVTFRNPVGALPTASGSSVNLTGPGGDAFQFSAGFLLTPGQSFSFDGLSIETVIPAAFATDFNTASTEFSLIGSLSIFGGSPADPGQWVHLGQAASNGVPAPAGWLLLAGGGLVGAAVRRRRPRRRR